MQNTLYIPLHKTYKKNTFKQQMPYFLKKKNLQIFYYNII